jgi:hypothetical protein
MALESFRWPSSTRGGGVHRQVPRALAEDGEQIRRSLQSKSSCERGCKRFVWCCERSACGGVRLWCLAVSFLLFSATVLGVLPGVLAYLASDHKHNTNGAVCKLQRGLGGVAASDQLLPCPSVHNTRTRLTNPWCYRCDMPAATLGPVPLRSVNTAPSSAADTDALPARA